MPFLSPNLDQRKAEKADALAEPDDDNNSDNDSGYSSSSSTDNNENKNENQITCDNCGQILFLSIIMIDIICQVKVSRGDTVQAHRELLTYWLCYGQKVSFLSTFDLIFLILKTPSY